MSDPKVRTRVFTIFGWSPGLRQLASSAVLACGCAIGTYETWGKGLVTIIDAPARECTYPDHRANAVIETPSSRRA